jgi:glycosyltransferase involved in cell wall biosynthesis
VEAEGEAYRAELEAQVARSGLGRNVLFLDRFAELCDLVGYLLDTDIFVAPYKDLTRATSGALSYAAGAGKAIVATPFLHARELLSDGRGRLVPPRNARALARAVLELLDDPGAMAQMRQRAYARSRRMLWPVIAREYLALFDSVRAGRAARARAERAVRAARALRALHASRGPSKPTGPTVRRAAPARRRDDRSFGGI